MERTYRTKEETIKYFKECAYEFEKLARQADKKNDIANYAFYSGKASAYDIAAFELDRNMK